MTAEPPVEAGANHDTVTDESPDTPVTLPGADGAVGSAPATTAAETVAEDDPTPLVTTTLNVYVTPEIRPLNSQDVATVTHTTSSVPGSSSDAVTVNALIGEPRLFGTGHETTATSPAAPTDTNDTASATPAGTTVFDTADTGDAPETFEARTVNVYDTPFTRPDTTHDAAVVVVQVNAPGTETTMNPLTAAPPSDTGAVHDTTDWPFSPDVADTPLTTDGTAEGTTTPEGSEAAPVPAAFDAVTVNEYAVPLVNPTTVHDNERDETHIAPPGDATTVYDTITEPPDDTGATHETTD